MLPKRKCINGKAFENQIGSDRFIRKLYLNARWADVNFLFDSDDGVKRIPANKAVLANRSDVFDAMFYGELKEVGDIVVADVSLDAFHEFLQFFYLTNVELTIDNIDEVMYLGHKYNFTQCMDICDEFLKETLTDDNVCLVLKLAMLYDQHELQTYCEAYIGVHTEAVFNTSNFRECDKSILMHILKLNFLFCSESVVFNACMSWIRAKAEQNVAAKELIQVHLSELFNEIHFASMSFEEFCGAEYEHIMHTMESPEAALALFNEHLRQRRWNEENIIICNRRKIGPTNISGSQHFFLTKMSKFESNRLILLGSLTFAPILYDRNSNFPIDVTIFEASRFNNSDEVITKLISDFEIILTSGKQKSVSLPEPILIRPGFFYEIHLDFCAERRMYEGENLSGQVHLENNTSIKFYNDREFYGDLKNIIIALGLNEI